MGKNAEYAAQYADLAKEQMRRYGIPASVTLAQGILESSNGKSELSRLGNNHFGIKATSSWLKSGGEYLVYTDDKPNERFCKYASVGDSYEHHSKFLAENSRYAKCFKLSPDDYKGWTEGIAKAGYATGAGYARNLQKIIEANGLDKYDKQVMAEMKAQGKSFGTAQNPREHTSPSASQTAGAKMVPTGEYSMPVKRDEFLFITSPFGMRKDPLGSGKQMMHKGIDIKCHGDNVLATENNGKVVAVNHNASASTGKCVTVEYSRPDGSKVQNVYMHLSSIEVKQGDTVNAGQKLGVSGSTGRSTGEHLHFGVKNIAADGTKRDIDPAIYLAEIAQKGNLAQQALYNGKDLLAKYKTETALPSTEQVAKTAEADMSPDAWMKKLLSSEDSGVGLSGTGDPVVEMAMTMFASLMMLAVQIDNKNDEEQKAAISESVSQRQVDLTSLVKGMKTATLTIGEKGRATLNADNGTTKVTRELTNAELSRLSTTLGDSDLSDEVKRMRVAGLVNNIVLSQQVSQNFDQGMQNAQQQQQSVKR